jgi:polysaccharide deacetylase family protein (PEP-CTERM system associated)
VINLAAQAGVRYSLINPHSYVDTNLVGFVNLLEGCRHTGVKHFVYASSSSVYGANTRMPFSVHDNVDHPVSLYAASKKANELMAHTYSHLFKLPTTGLRFFTVYGPWGRPDMALFLFTKAILEDIGDVAVRGYRAPSYSINGKNLWALDVLQETGHVYSSSIYPIRHDLYGMPEAPRFPFRLRPDAILEIPVTTVHMGGSNYPCGGGGYFRLLPYPAFRWMLRRVNDHDRQPGLFYFHPWELDPEQPRIEGSTVRSRFRHYLNLGAMEGRLGRLLSDFRWGRMDDVFGIT